MGKATGERLTEGAGLLVRGGAGKCGGAGSCVRIAIQYSGSMGGHEDVVMFDGKRTSNNRPPRAADVMDRRRLGKICFTPYEYYLLWDTLGSAPEGVTGTDFDIYLGNHDKARNYGLQDLPGLSRSRWEHAVHHNVKGQTVHEVRRMGRPGYGLDDTAELVTGWLPESPSLVFDDEEVLNFEDAVRQGSLGLEPELADEYDEAIRQRLGCDLGTAALVQVERPLLFARAV